MKLKFKVTKDGDYAIISARDENNLSLGYIVISVRRDERGAIAVIEVSDKNRKIGVGKQLVEKAEEIFRKYNIENIYTSDVASGAEGFWNKMGYKQKFGSRQWKKSLVKSYKSIKLPEYLNII